MIDGRNVSRKETVYDVSFGIDMDYTDLDIGDTLVS